MSYPSSINRISMATMPMTMVRRQCLLRGCQLLTQCISHIARPNHRPWIQRLIFPPSKLAINKGADVLATDARVGKVDELVIDPETHRITHLVLRQHFPSEQMDRDHSRFGNRNEPKWTRSF